MIKSAVIKVLSAIQDYRTLKPPACRFDPTCSSYALQAVNDHGPGRGLYLAARRILRCHPWGGRGYDPVPAATPPLTLPESHHA